MNYDIVNGGWRQEESFHLCSTYANGTRIETKHITKHCDNPTPQGGNLCPCNDTDPNEINCDGVSASIEIPCEGSN